MATIDELVVKISADTKELNNAFVKSEKVVKRSSENISRSSNLISGGLNKIKLASIAATVGVIAMGKSMTTEVDRLQKLSIRLGETTENLSRLKFVSEQSGVSFDTTAMALQRMQRRVAEAAQGTGEAKNALKELSINAEELNKLPLYEQFIVITKAMEGLGGASDRTRLAMKLFDSEGVALTQIMDKGAISVKKLADETPNIVTQETANNIAEFNDNMNVLSQNIQKYVLPVVTTLAKAINSLFPENNKTKSLQEELNLLQYTLENLEKSNTGGFISRVFGTDKEITSTKNRIQEIKKELETINIDKNTNKNNNVDGNFQNVSVDAKKTADSIKKSMNDSTESWSRNLSDAIIDSKSGFQSLADFANNVLRDIASQVVQSQIANPIIKSATDIFTNRNNTNTAPSIPMNTSAPSIQPTSSMISSGNNQNITINQTIQPLTGIDDNQVRAVLASQAPAIAEQAKISTLDAISRGGRARQVIRGV